MFGVLLVILAFYHLERGEHLDSTQIYTWHVFVKYLSHPCMNKWTKIWPGSCTPPGKLPANSMPEQCDTKRQHHLWFGKEWMTWVHSFVHSLISSLSRHHWGFTMSQVLCRPMGVTGKKGTVPSPRGVQRPLYRASVPPDDWDNTIKSQSLDLNGTLEGISKWKSVRLTSYAIVQGQIGLGLFLGLLLTSRSSFAALAHLGIVMHLLEGWNEVHKWHRMLRHRMT